jgi:hypothetical protein
MAGRRATLVKYPKKTKDIFVSEYFWNKLPMSAHVCQCLPFPACVHRTELVSTLHAPARLHVPLQPRDDDGTQSASIAKTAKMSSLAAGQRVVSFSSPLEALQAQREHHT